MSFQDFVHSVTGLITATAMLLTALAAFLPIWRSRSSDPVSPKAPSRAPLALPFLAGVLVGAALTILAARLLFPRDATVPADAPTVTIAQPGQGNDLKAALDASGSARFDVAGSSTGVSGQNRRRIYLLVHPEQPPAAGWWIQPDVALEPSGKWTGIGWIGSQASQAAPGHRLLIMAIVAPDREPVPTDSAGVPWVRSPSVLEPAAVSNVVRVGIREVAPMPK
jgi:hypothetical protein